MKEQFSLPQKMAFAKGNRDKLFSFRLYEPLLNEFKKIAKDRGCSTADAIVHALDQYAQWAKAHRSK